MEQYLETLSDLLYTDTEFRINCPLCGEENHKLYMQSEPPYLWHCKKCDEYGNPIKLVQRVNNCNFRQANQILLDAGVDLSDDELSAFNKQYQNTELTSKEAIYLALNRRNKPTTALEVLTCPKLPAGFKTLKSQFNNPEARPYFYYLGGRGVTMEQISFHNIGYTEEFFIKSHKGNDVAIRNMLVFLTYNDKGEVIYWNTRSIYDNFIKTLNAPSSKTEYGKDNVIFNLNVAKRTGTIVICESVFNALTIGDWGVATFGKQVTSDQIALLREVCLEKPSTRLYVFLDSDANTQASALADKLLTFTPNVYVVNNPTSQDVNDMGRDTAYKMLQQTPKYTKQNSIGLFL